ncbi:conserved Plasmodium protein, unknown function [Plasmodium ovale wallikeri]|uniref:Uncharacterized protein n=1 Tax=Plasmodium ovale wallikeri TaxID=864142 RepID=A0A1A9A0G0_PLAOA|nr:conserved Plasmodium protein, unknown function [Plasmodium ovale wallikeri]
MLNIVHLTRWLKKSIWFASIGLEIKNFVDYCYKDNEELEKEKAKIFQEIVKIDCPVLLRDKNTVLVESEIAPKKVINSAKRMRYFFNVSEVHKYAGEPDFSDFTRLICKIYIKRKDTNRDELRHLVERVNYFHFALLYMYGYMLKHKHFNYSNVEEQNRSVILKLLREKRKHMLVLKHKKEQEKILNIPREFLNVMIPTEKAKMKRRQMNIFERVQKFTKSAHIPEEEEKFIWVEEKDDTGPHEEEPCNDNFSGRDDILQKMEEETEDSTTRDGHHDNALVEIKDRGDEIPAFRFHYASYKEDDTTRSTIVSYNKIYNKYTKQLEKKVFVNIDDQDINEDIAKSENILFNLPEEVGGYTFINYVENTPNNYIFPINENLYKGIQVYKKEEINLGSLWKGIEDEPLKIRKIDFLNPFNIKHNIDMRKQRKGTAKKAGSTDKEDKAITELTDLEDDMSSFQEYVRNANALEKKKQGRRRKYAGLETPPSYGTPDDDSKNDEDNEDKRFEYFKKLRNERTELKEEFNTIYDDTYSGRCSGFHNEMEEGTTRSYTHTYNLRRKLNDEEKDLKGVALVDIEKEKRRLIEDDKRELKEEAFYICKNVKFPELKEGTDIKTKNRNKFLHDELQKYIRPQSIKKKNKFSELRYETVEAHSTAIKG